MRKTKHISLQVSDSADSIFRYACEVLGVTQRELFERMIGHYFPSVRGELRRIENGCIDIVNEKLEDSEIKYYGHASGVKTKEEFLAEARELSDCAMRYEEMRLKMASIEMKDHTGFWNMVHKYKQWGSK